MSASDVRRLLLEVGVEEMPALAARAGLEQLTQTGTRLLVENRLLTTEAAAEAVQVMGTPRRLTLIVEGVSEAQRTEAQEIKGPPAKIAFDSEGKPAPAAVGFAKAQGVAVESLEVREVDDGDYLFAVKELTGQPAAQVLPEILGKLIDSLEFTKAMRWGSGRFKFIRPIRWLTALYGSELVPFEVAGVPSGRLTYGHRFLAAGPVELTNASQYEEVMLAAQVAVDHRDRRDQIERMVKEAAAEAGGRAFADPTDVKVLDEVTFLVEAPQVVVGDFDQEFLKIPRAALVTAMKSHQRYFPIEDKEGNLSPRFAVIHNGDPAAAERIQRGHERVLRARLADAAFFFEEDTKTPLSSKVDKLKTVVWQAELGSMYDKTVRLQALAGHLAELLSLPSATKAAVERGALLAKADLTTAMVIEFTDLQGVIGSEYALVDGEEAVVSQAVVEHYQPSFAGDSLPGEIVSQVIAVADKLDTLAGCFLIGLIPTGSADPYALRRQAAGVVQILAQTEWSFAILDLAKLAIDNYAALVSGERDPGAVAVELHTFMLARLRRQLVDTGVSAEAVEAVLRAGHDVVDEVGGRARVLDAMRGRSELENVRLAFTRCRNLAQPELGTQIDERLFEHEIEGKLLGAAREARTAIDQELAVGRLEAVMTLIASLRPVIDEFFEVVMVMAEDDKVKSNRLRLLNLCVALSDEIADFSSLPQVKSQATGA